jgi:hypothetical protein
MPRYKLEADRFRTMTSHTLSQHEQLQLDAQLAPGEVIVWTGKPLRHIVFHKTDWLIIPFSLAFAAFTLFWEWHAFRTWGDWFLKLGGIPLILMGQYLVWGRFVYSAWRKRRTVCAVTNQRALSLYSGLRNKVVDESLKALDRRTLDLRENDSVGTITFHADAYAYRQPGPDEVPSSDATVPLFSFVDIEHAHDVDLLIEAERAKLMARSETKTLQGVS